MVSIGLKSVVTVVYVFMLLPVVYVVLSSISGSASLAFPPTSLSLQWYGSIPRPFVDSLILSLEIAIMVTLVSSVLGTTLAMLLARWNGPGRATLNTLCLSPLMVPPLVLGVALFQFSIFVRGWSGWALAGSTFGIIVGQSVLCLPLVVRSVIAAHAHFDGNLEEAALNLGASPKRVFFTITLRALVPGIVSGGVFAFLMSLDDVPVALFLGSGEVQTLPVRIFSALEYSYSPSIMAISTILILASLALMAVLHRIFGLERLFGFGRS
jgi:putative spermidine/putrescine transport system permease protein